MLKRLTIDVTFVRGGKFLFKAVTWAGYVGVLTGWMDNPNPNLNPNPHRNPHPTLTLTLTPTLTLTLSTSLPEAPRYTP